MITLLNLLHRDKVSALSLPHLGGDGPKSTKPTQPTMAHQQCFIAKPTCIWGDRMKEKRLSNMPAPVVHRNYRFSGPLKPHASNMAMPQISIMDLRLLYSTPGACYDL